MKRCKRCNILTTRKPANGLCRACERDTSESKEALLVEAVDLLKSWIEGNCIGTASPDSWIMETSKEVVAKAKVLL